MTTRRTGTNTAHTRSCDPSGRERGVAVALLIAPTLLAAGWGVLLGNAGPSNAYAQNGSASIDAALPAKPPRKPTDEEQSARAYCAEIYARIDAIEPPTMLPMLHDEELPFFEEDPEETVAEGITIGSILRDAQGRPSVYVDGALYVEGDGLSGGWTIATIDLPTRTVTLEHASRAEPLTLSPGR